MLGCKRQKQIHNFIPLSPQSLTYSTKRQGLSYNFRIGLVLNRGNKITLYIYWEIVIQVIEFSYKQNKRANYWKDIAAASLNSFRQL